MPGMEIAYKTALKLSAFSIIYYKNDMNLPGRIQLRDSAPLYCREILYLK